MSNLTVILLVHFLSFNFFLWFIHWANRYILRDPKAAKFPGKPTVGSFSRSRSKVDQRWKKSQTEQVGEG